MKPGLFLFDTVPMNAIQGEYDFQLVAISYLIAMIASYVAFDLVTCLIAEQPGYAKKYWLMGSAFTFGMGIWAMHFIGLQSLSFLTLFTYNLPWTLGTILFSIFSSGLSFYLLKEKNIKKINLMISAIILGISLIIVNYLGLMSLNNHIDVGVPIFFYLSIPIAIFIIYFAFFLTAKSGERFLKKNVILKFFAAIIMALAICGMHYAEIASAVFFPNVDSIIPADFIDKKYLTYSVTAMIGIILFIAIIVSTYVQILSAAQNEKNFLNTLLKNLEDGILACDSRGKIILFNRAAKKIFNINSDDEFSEQKWMDAFDLYLADKDLIMPKEQFPLQIALTGKKIQNLELVVAPKQGIIRTVMINGQSIINEQKKKMGAVITIHDITEHKRMEQLLTHQATHDTLTGLPNRFLLIDRIEQAIHFAKRSQSLVAVLFFDLDRFKLINDSLGHDKGDIVLCEAAQRLKNYLREVDTIARIGGDEFVVILTALKSENDAVELAKKTLHALSKPFKTAAANVYITTSIGISFFPNNGDDAHSLIKNADAAMYKAKDDGRNKYVCYTPDMGMKSMKHLELESIMYRAIEHDEFELHYQPIIDLKSGQLNGFEALLRLHHPELGLLRPLDFIPLAEKSNLIIQIGEWVLRTACKQNKLWQEQGFQKVRIAVNISSRQFSETDMVSLVKKVLEDTGLEGKYLGLEITESVILDHTENIISTLQELKDMDIQISLDDFGTGFSSLSYLKRLPVDKVKIDKSFIQDMTKNSDDTAIVSAIIGMANSLKLKVVAEGTETSEQLALLNLHQCHETQGYYFYHPLNVSDCEKLFNEQLAKMTGT